MLAVRTPILRRAGACALVLGLLGCSGARTPCVSAGACGAGSECLANTCVPQGGEPVRPETWREALEPSRWQVISPGTHDLSQPGAVHFGGGLAEERLVLDFKLPNVPASHVERAFLLLEPLPDSSPTAETIEVSAWRITEAWDRVAWLHQPATSPPHGKGLARTTLPLRIDVTALVRRWLDNPSSTHGVVLHAETGAGLGHAFATGVSRGRAPLLEIYHAEPRDSADVGAGGRAKAGKATPARSGPTKLKNKQPQAKQPQAKRRQSKPQSQPKPKPKAAPKPAKPKATSKPGGEP